MSVLLERQRKTKWNKNTPNRQEHSACKTSHFAQPSRWVSQVRHSAANAPDPGVLMLVEHMIARKRSRFGDDQRLIGEHKFVRRDGELRLRAEAKTPYR